MCQGCKPDISKLHSSYIGMNICDSAYENGCVVDDTCDFVLFIYFSIQVLFALLCSPHYCF